MRKLWNLVLSLPVLSFLSSCSSYEGEYSREELDRLRSAAHVKPHPRQLAWQQLEMTAFFHFTVNTFTNREWGNGKEDPDVFQPAELDCGQWVRTAKNAGFNLAILTAKHHDGFCLWPSEHTDHDVASSSWRNGEGDVVREFVEACRKYDMKAGIYLSPWDRHEPTYGSEAYNDYFCSQLTELIDNYGPFDEIWFDGACGEGPNGKKQVYDWERYYSLIREKLPDAVIAVAGPDVRWVGNEHGLAKETEWSVVPGSAFDQEDVEKQFEAFHFEGVEEQSPGKGFAEKYSRSTGSDLFRNRMAVLKAEDLKWYPSECDVSIRPGWFYHPLEDNLVKSLKHMLKIYYSSVGRNSVLLLNLPPDRRGLIHENDVKRLEEFSEVIASSFDHDLAEGAAVTVSSLHPEGGREPGALTDGNPETWWAADREDLSPAVTLEMEQPVRFDRILLAENIRAGQRVERFRVEYHTPSGWRTAATGTTIGFKRLLKIRRPLESDRIRLILESCRDYPEICRIGLYLSDERDR